VRGVPGFPAAAYRPGVSKYRCSPSGVAVKATVRKSSVRAGAQFPSSSSTIPTSASEIGSVSPVARFNRAIWINRGDHLALFNPSVRQHHTDGAQQVRRKLQLGETDILNLQRPADKHPPHVFFPQDLVPGGLAALARVIDWDGFAFVFPGETSLMVLLNSARPPRRRSATLLEELSHHLRGHQPSRLVRDSVTRLLRREFNKAQEEEAYDFGSMLLLPKELIQYHVKERRGTADELADRCGCSVDLVEMRIKRCRLWQRHLANGN